jgi:hypothetical protein
MTGSAKPSIAPQAEMRITSELTRLVMTVFGPAAQLYRPGVTSNVKQTSATLNGMSAMGATNKRHMRRNK